LYAFEGGLEAEEFAAETTKGVNNQNRQYGPDTCA